MNNSLTKIATEVKKGMLSSQNVTLNTTVALVNLLGDFMGVTMRIWHLLFYLLDYLLFNCFTCLLFDLTVDLGVPV